MNPDILIDADIAARFCSPVDPEYKLLIEWIDKRGHLVVTQALLSSYVGGSGSAWSPTSMPILIDRLTREGRLTRFSKQQLTDFRFTRAFERKMRSNKADHNNIKAVMMSHRKYALSRDVNFCHDVNNCPSFGATAAQRPQDLPYAA